MKKVIKIGRGKDNNVVLANPSVSSHHAVLTVFEDGMLGEIVDLSSTNGTYVNDRRISAPTKVKSFDKLRFGNDTPVTISELTNRANKTVIRENRPANHPAGITIGRNADNQVRIPNDDVSGRHAVLYRNQQGDTVIEDLNSTNGTYVNGNRVATQALHAGDKVTITRNYPLMWETLMPPKPAPAHAPAPKKSNTGLMIAAGIAACFFVMVLVVGQIIIWPKPWKHEVAPVDPVDNPLKPYTAEQIYDMYKNTVCLVYGEYGYKVMVDGQDLTNGLVGEDYISLDSYGNPVPGTTGYTGTAFFISEDGKLGTNLHIVRPWLYSEQEKFALENMLKEFFPQLLMHNFEVKGVLSYVGVLPNGLALAQENLVKCLEYGGHDNTDIDVAIIQTANKKVVDGCTNVLSLADADFSDEALKQGKPVYLIGFPHGTEIAFDNKGFIQNQIQDGKITQDRGDYEFGHNAATFGGASGSPVINEYGKLIGIHHAGLSQIDSHGFNWAIKAKYLDKLMDK